MRVLLLLLGGLLAAESPGLKSVDQGVPLARMKPTGDVWDSPFSASRAPCEGVRNQVTFVTPPGRRSEAEALLKDVSVRPLSDQEAARLLDRKDPDKLFADLLIEQWKALNAQRRAALIDHRGNWSEADSATSSDLITLTQTHYPAYRPYLVRALNGASEYAYFTVHLCGDTLTVNGTSGSEKATRTPLIVYLQAAPVAAIPHWFTQASATKFDPRGQG
jgi:hypothetical protein